MPLCRWLARRVPERHRHLLLNPPARLGRRGAVLLILGCAWIIQGIAVAVRPYDPPRQIHEQLPEWVRVTIWAGTGAVAVVSAFRRRPGQDTPGFVSLMIPLGIRAFSYTWGTFTWLITGEGSALSFLSATLWFVLIVLVVTIAGWPEPRPVDPPET